MSGKNVDVLVVGGSTVGLVTALFLARRGVTTLVAERHEAPLAHPRAMGIGPRTVEILREAGLVEAVDAVCVDMSQSNLQMFSARTLAEADLPALDARAPRRTDDFAHLTPSALRGTCPQGRLDSVVAEAARAAGAEVAFGCELLSYEQDDDGVTARLADPEGPLTVRARYLVGADGARSSVRTALGIGTTGPGDLGLPVVSMLFRADLSALTRGKTFLVCDITGPEGAGGLLPVDGDREWIYHTYYDPAAGQSFEDYTPERCRERIRAAVGIPDLDVEIVSLLPWQARARVAERFAAGRVFLAGDAAHVIPPVGAFGMYTGIADAHNLAWKLALVLRGSAGTQLLDSYDAERRPVALTTMEQAMLRLGDPSLHWSRGPAGAEKRAAAGALNAPVVHLGYRYDSEAVVGARPELPSTEDVGLTLDGSPGSRLPHLWLKGPAGRVSTMDLVEGRFTLLAGAAGAAWCTAAAQAAEALGVEVATHLIGPDGDVTDPEGQWAQLSGTGPDGALLVRPDGFVGWRSSSAPDASGDVVRDVLARLHGRTAMV